MSIEVGARVQQVRRNANLSQRDFATRLDISSGGISQIESGKTMPGGDFLLRIHQEFGVDVTWLLTGMSIGGMLPTAAPISEGDKTLLDNFHAAPAQVQSGIKMALGAFTPGAGTHSKRGKAA